MIIGQYVKTFKEADMGMLEGASLNAPYEFHWLYIKSVEPNKIICTTHDGGGREMTLQYKNGKHGERAEVTVHDPIFGPLKFSVAPFKRSHP